MNPTDLQRLRNKIRNLRRMGATKSAAVQQRKLGEIVDANLDQLDWIIYTLFGLNGTERDLDELLGDFK